MNTYKIIGADGREYGPISSEQLRQWIAQGRANAHTKVLSEGSTDWKLLSELPEFSADLAAKQGSPRPQPVTATTAVNPLVNEILARDYDLKIGSCIGRGWELLKRHFWLTVGATFLIHLIVGVVGGIPLLGWALNGVFIGGLDWMFLKLVRGQKAELGDCFASFDLAFMPLALYGLVSAALIMLGLILCILPGIYLAICWVLFTPLIILDKRLDFWAAMEVARKVVSKHWWQLFGFALLCVLVVICGSLICGVGVFIAMPIVRAAIVYAYDDIFGTPAAPASALPTT